MEKEAQNQIIRWGVTAVLILVGAGFGSLANRNVYTKEQVNEKIERVVETRDVQYRAIMRELSQIRNDLHDIKKER